MRGTCGLRKLTPGLPYQFVSSSFHFSTVSVMQMRWASPFHRAIHVDITAPNPNWEASAASLKG